MLLAKCIEMFLLLSATDYFIFHLTTGCVATRPYCCINGMCCVWLPLCSHVAVVDVNGWGMLFTGQCIDDFLVLPLCLSTGWTRSTAAVRSFCKTSSLFKGNLFGVMCICCSSMCVFAGWCLPSTSIKRNHTSSGRPTTMRPAASLASLNFKRLKDVWEVHGPDQGATIFPIPLLFSPWNDLLQQQ